MASQTSLFLLLRIRLLLFTTFLCLSIRTSKAFTTLSNETLHSLHVESSDFDIHNGPLLAPILRPRVPGTLSHEAVLSHLVDFFRDQLPKWTIEMQNSTSTTPATGSDLIPFTNLILTRDPPWTSPGEVGRLALAAHYDSKLTPHGFIGATDSAVPCAMLLHAARAVDEALTRKWDAMAAQGVDEFDGLEEHKGIQILLLDGEEAFVSWTRDDSLYGARYDSLPVIRSQRLIDLPTAHSPKNGKVPTTRLFRPTGLL
jgi:glutaminyl-peptide cyclotransferase